LIARLLVLALLPDVQTLNDDVELLRCLEVEQVLLEDAFAKSTKRMRSKCKSSKVRQNERENERKISNKRNFKGKELKNERKKETRYPKSVKAMHTHSVVCRRHS
jgi:hypothetical protein